MQQIAAICLEYNLEIDCIPKGVDDYLCFSVTKFIKTLKRSAADDTADVAQVKSTKYCEWKLKFLDSLQFLSSSLATLVENLKAKVVIILKLH